jgi:hypothetical protein
MAFKRANPAVNKILSKATLQRILLSVVIILVLSIFIKVQVVIFLVIAIFFNAKLAKFQISKGLPTDFELSTFMTVMVTLATHDLKLGLVVAVLSKLIASIATANILADHLFMILTYIIAATIAFFVGGEPQGIGLTIVVIDCALMFLISKNILGLDITSNFSYTMTNFFFNLTVFLILARPVYSILVS